MCHVLCGVIHAFVMEFPSLRIKICGKKTLAVKLVVGFPRKDIYGGGAAFFTFAVLDFYSHLVARAHLATLHIRTLSSLEADSPVLCRNCEHRPALHNCTMTAPRCTTVHCGRDSRSTLSFPALDRNGRCTRASARHPWNGRSGAPSSFLR
jgi:hypothetical protein